MEYRTLGRTGLRVSAVALGCEGFMNRPEEEVRADFDFAIENGINFLDLYASNPELRSSIGAALARRREGFVIQGHLCSVWEEGQYLRTRDPEKAQAAFDDLLARLGTDYVDIGMIHYVDAELDGGRIIAQRAFPYEGNDIEELEQMIHAVEYPLYIETIGKLIR